MESDRHNRCALRPDPDARSNAHRHRNGNGYAYGYGYGYGYANWYGSPDADGNSYICAHSNTDCQSHASADSDPNADANTWLWPDSRL